LNDILDNLSTRGREAEVHKFSDFIIN